MIFTCNYSGLWTFLDNFHKIVRLVSTLTETEEMEQKKNWNKYNENLCYQFICSSLNFSRMISLVILCHETRPNNKSSLKWFHFVCGDFFSIWELAQKCLLIKRRHSKLLSFITICYFLPRIKSCHILMSSLHFRGADTNVWLFFRIFVPTATICSKYPNFKSVNVHDFLSSTYFFLSCIRFICRPLVCFCFCLVCVCIGFVFFFKNVRMVAL